MFGPPGSGKSAFICTCERTVRETERGTAHVESGGKEGTLTLRDYLPEMFFRLVDTRCFFEFNTAENAEEFRNILEGKIRSGQELVRYYGERPSDPKMKLNPRPAFEDRLHGIIFVVKGTCPRLENYRDEMRQFRVILKEMGNVCLVFLVMLSTFIDPVHKAKNPSSYAYKIP